MAATRDIPDYRRVTPRSHAWGILTLRALVICGALGILGFWFVLIWVGQVADEAMGASYRAPSFVDWRALYLYSAVSGAILVALLPHRPIIAHLVALWLLPVLGIAIYVMGIALSLVPIGLGMLGAALVFYLLYYLVYWR